MHAALGQQPRCDSRVQGQEPVHQLGQLHKRCMSEDKHGSRQLGVVVVGSSSTFRWLAVGVRAKRASASDTRRR
eukprot:351666-Chlamydomonas_euryale.AAC.5